MANQAPKILLFHYHLFKNAGSSIDQLLRTNFPDQCSTREFSHRNSPLLHTQVREWVLEEKDSLVFSSHTARLPPPILDNAVIFPIIFVRHPIVRIQSAYDFERAQDSETFGSRLAKECSFKDYVLKRLDNPTDFAIQNFQSTRISELMDKSFGNLHIRTAAALSLLEFVGVVEFFPESIQRLTELLARHNISFVYQEVFQNVGPKINMGYEERVEVVKSELGKEVFEKLCVENACDFFLYNSTLNKMGF